MGQIFSINWPRTLVKETFKMQFTKFHYCHCVWAVAWSDLRSYVIFHGCAMLNKSFKVPQCLLVIGQRYQTLVLFKVILHRMVANLLRYINNQKSNCLWSFKVRRNQRNLCVYLCLKVSRRGGGGVLGPLLGSATNMYILSIAYRM